jgi:hypothetical protein
MKLKEEREKKVPFPPYPLGPPSPFPSKKRERRKNPNYKSSQKFFITKMYVSY